MEELKKTIREIPDFPKPGILFYDITTLWRDADAFRLAQDLLGKAVADLKPDLIAGIEARGFVVGAPLAYSLGAGFVVVRKPGKLPGATRSATYTLEYREDWVEIHEGAVEEGQSVLIVDDLLATGGTAEATAKLVEEMGGRVVGLAFLTELEFLGGRDKLDGYNVISLIRYDE